MVDIPQEVNQESFKMEILRLVITGISRRCSTELSKRSSDPGENTTENDGEGKKIQFVYSGEQAC